MKKNRLLPGILLFIGAFIVSILVYQDYGISWDEPVQREMGIVSYKYVFEKDNTLDQYIERDHGVGFELPLVLIEKKLHLEDPREIYLMRHLVSNLFFLLGAFCGYVLALRLFKKQWIASFAFLMLVFHPRLFAHSFFNSKDIPLMVMFTVTFLIVNIAFQRQKWHWMLFAGMVVGYTTSIRILGIVIASGIIGFLIIDVIAAVVKKKNTWQQVVFLSSFLIGFSLILYAAWPALWSHPISSFISFYNSNAHFRWSSDVLIAGERISAAQLPYSYLLVWFAITTPIVWLVLGLVGIIMTVVMFLRNPKIIIQNSEERQMLLFLYCTITPVAMVILLHSIVYDDWRHVYFIYPSFVMLALYAVSKIKTQIIKSIIVFALLVQCVFVGYQMIQLHPFEQVYFNRLVSHREEFLRNNYELDYWGAGYKQALEYLITNSKEQEIKIASGTAPLSNNIGMLKMRDRNRIKIVDESEATYLITNFRGHSEDYPYPNVVWELRRENSSLMKIYKIR